MEKLKSSLFTKDERFTEDETLMERGIQLFIEGLERAARRDPVLNEIWQKKNAILSGDIAARYALFLIDRIPHYNLKEVLGALIAQLQAGVIEYQEKMAKPAGDPPATPPRPRGRPPKQPAPEG